MRKRPIVITGANGGLGSSLVKHLWNEGWQVIGTYRTSCERIKREFPDDLDHTNRKVAEFHNVHLLNESKVDEFAGLVIARYGAPWAIINLAGGSTNSMSWKMTATQFRDVLDQNLVTTFNVCKAFIPAMRDTGSGRIINASSVVGFTGVVGASHYAAAKAGIVGLTKSLALELAPKVSVNALAMGYFNVGLIEDVSPEIQKLVIDKTPAKRLGETKELNALVSFLLKEESAFITGQALHINGGLL